MKEYLVIVRLYVLLMTCVPSLGQFYPSQLQTPIPIPSSSFRNTTRTYFCDRARAVQNGSRTLRLGLEGMQGMQ